MLLNAPYWPDTVHVILNMRTDLFISRMVDSFLLLNRFSRNDNALVLFQDIIGLYILTINPSTIQLNSFARDAISKLTRVFDPTLYEDFVDKWGTHIVTKSLIGGMIEEQAKVLRRLSGDEQSLFIQCLPFDHHQLSNSACTHYAHRNQIISKRRLGGNTQAVSRHEWKKSLSFAPAMLQILAMFPWSDFVSDESIKRNLHTMIRNREKLVDSNRDEAIQLLDTRLTSCTKGIGIFY